MTRNSVLYSLPFLCDSSITGSTRGRSSGSRALKRLPKLKLRPAEDRKARCISALNKPYLRPHPKTISRCPNFRRHKESARLSLYKTVFPFGGRSRLWRKRRFPDLLLSVEDTAQ